MDFLTILILCLVGVNLLMTILNKVLKKDPPPQQQEQQVVIPEIPAPQVHIDMRPVEDSIKALPNKVLQSIQGSVNVHKGVLGELIGYTQLRAQYDRIIPLGNIVDFICIKFPKEDQEGCVDFVDVKTGNKKRLSQDQRALQKLIDDKKINFIKVKVETSADQPTRS